ncbi:uncharacterized protein LOC123014294 isoform X3 [Tribolium madens]|uniref:uncharacterized protein LOC123014294 isoform X3 n=1 Tax=Tribolium madens TaxID=41895 RepID=UPI001CF7572F|nr:uncharacterized protein LOC123014294 isoform X3 [Tribolium madens]
MRIAFGVIFITGIFGGFFAENVFALPVAHHHVISKDLDRTAVDEMYKSYISISNDRGDDNDEVISRVQQVYLDSPKISVSKNDLTLCHFKICNMGRKRTSRYFHMIRQLDDNEA